MKLLVTGGAGYIGSAVTASLIEAGHDVTVLDDLSTGHADAVPPKASFVHGTLRDDAAPVLADGTDAVLHFAAKSLVGESVAHPDLYWSHNLGGSPVTTPTTAAPPMICTVSQHNCERNKLTLENSTTARFAA